MSPPSLCGTFLTGKRSLVAFIWTITTICTYLAFILAIGAIIQNDDDAGGGDRGSADREQALAQYMWLAALSSTSLTLCAVYIMVMAVALTMYGSTAVVGFISLRGVYIAPCFSSKGLRLRLGLFGGAVILFVNLLIVCAVVFGEVRVEDGRNGDDRGDTVPYEIERIATIMAVTCIFLAVLYTIFAIVLFLYFGNGDTIDDETANALSMMGVGSRVETSTPLASNINDSRRENFITLDHHGYQPS